MPMSFTEIQVAEQLQKQRDAMNRPARRMAELAQNEIAYRARQAAYASRQQATRQAAAQKAVVPVAPAAPVMTPGEYEEAVQSAYRSQIEAVRKSAQEQGMTAGETEAYIQLAQRTGQAEEKTMAGTLDPQALAVANAVSDVALRLLRDEVREAGLSGLGQFDFGSLITAAVSAAGSVASSYIKGRTDVTVAKRNAELVAMQERMAQQQADLQAAMAQKAADEQSSMSSVLPVGFTSTLAQPTVWIPVALAGGALVLFLMMRK